ncbi:MAG: aminotransferase class V-fold PLP-dependent enzyme [Acidobacteriota bacterium]|nr:aminotransferase class V-fold PLP-dependent enzyme [Acidobacteriota bacterium]
MNRRHLLQLAGAGTARLLSAATTPAEAATNEDFWSAIRNEFTTDKTVVNLNNGYASPAPRKVQEALRRYNDYTNMGPYHTMVRELEPRVETVRHMIADAAGVDPETIAITRNSSESLEIAQFGLNLKAGDEVITTNQDYPRMLTTYRQRARRDGIKLKELSFKVPVQSMDDLYNMFEQAVTPATRVIHFCHITNRTGQIFPVRRICDMAAARGIATIVDGAHAFSQFPFRLSDFNCDYYGVSLHKWTFGPMGTGFLYVRRSRIRDTWPLMAADTRQDDDIRKFEEIGTHPSAIHNALCEAISFNREMGIDRKAARLRYLRDRWAEPLAAAPKCRILHNPKPEMSCGIGMLAVDGDAAKLAGILQNKYRIYTGLMGHEEYTGIRITPSVYTSIQEIDYFVDAVRREVPGV